MHYVYLVYDDLHGLQCVCADKAKATEKVSNIAYNIYELPKHTEPDYDDEDCYGFDGAAMWQRAEVE
jgi:hypothetical protein